MKLEFKEIELKATDEIGTFKGVASPYNNIDLGNDRVLPSVGKKNDGKKVPMLWQHDTHSPIGEMVLSNGTKGVECEAKFYIDKDADKQYLLPKAAEAYLLAKKGLLKLSIGYQTKDYEYVVEGTKTVRNLKDIDIKEVSCVTFPMNEDAKITNVKEEGNNIEKKAMSFTELLELRKSREMRWQLKDALDSSISQLINDDTMKEEEKIAQLNKNIDDFATAYKETMTTLIKASASGKKEEALKAFEIKENKEQTNKPLGLEEVKEFLSSIKDENLIKEIKETLGIKEEPETKEFEEDEIKTDELEAIKALYEIVIEQKEDNV